jgi:hypothetical protein
MGYYQDKRYQVNTEFKAQLVKFLGRVAGGVIRIFCDMSGIQWWHTSCPEP